MGILDSLFSGLNTNLGGAPVTPNTDLTSKSLLSKLFTQPSSPLFNLGLGLLKAGGTPTPYKQNFGAVLGQGLEYAKDASLKQNASDSQKLLSLAQLKQSEDNVIIKNLLAQAKLKQSIENPFKTQVEAGNFISKMLNESKTRNLTDLEKNQLKFAYSLVGKPTLQLKQQPDGTYKPEMTQPLNPGAIFPGVNNLIGGTTQQSPTVNNQTSPVTNNQSQESIRQRAIELIKNKYPGITDPAEIESLLKKHMEGLNLRYAPPNSQQKYQSFNPWGEPPKQQPQTVNKAFKPADLVKSEKTIVGHDSFINRSNELINLIEKNPGSAGTVGDIRRGVGTGLGVAGDVVGSLGFNNAGKSLNNTAKKVGGVPDEVYLKMKTLTPEVAKNVVNQGISGSRITDNDIKVARQILSGEGLNSQQSVVRSLKILRDYTIKMKQDEIDHAAGKLKIVVDSSGKRRYERVFGNGSYETPKSPMKYEDVKKKWGIE